LHYWQSRPGVGEISHGYAEIIGKTTAVRLDDAIVNIGAFTNGVIDDLRASELDSGGIVFTWKQRNFYPAGAGTIIREETQVTVLDPDLQGFTRPGTAGDDVLKGSTYDDSLYGLDGNDTLGGMAGPTSSTEATGRTPPTTTGHCRPSM
jgi:Ca2+-binding RTX toxin-like protein